MYCIHTIYITILFGFTIQTLSRAKVFMQLFNNLCYFFHVLYVFVAFYYFWNVFLIYG